MGKMPAFLMKAKADKKGKKPKFPDGGSVGERVGRMLRGKQSPPPGTDDRMKPPGKQSPPPGTKNRMTPPPPPMRPDPYERMPKKSEGWNEGMLRTDTNIQGKKKGGKVVKKAKGGPIDGVATKGKTRAKQVKMKRGGKC